MTTILLGPFRRAESGVRTTLRRLGQQIAWRYRAIVREKPDFRGLTDAQILGKLREALVDETDGGKLKLWQAAIAKDMERAIREVLADNKVAKDALEVAVDRFRQFQPGATPPKIEIDALSSTPDYGGFNFNSLKRRGPDAPAFESEISSIRAEEQMRELYINLRAKNPKLAEYPQWRKDLYERWTVESGYLLKGAIRDR